MSNRKKKSAFFVGNRREGEYFRQRNLTRGGGSRRGGVALLRSLADGCLGARPQGRTLAERPFGEGNRAVARGLVLEWRSACGRLLEARLVGGGGPGMSAQSQKNPAPGARMAYFNSLPFFCKSFMQSR